MDVIKGCIKTKGNPTFEKPPLFPSDLLKRVPLILALSSDILFQLKVFMLCTACFFGWRANSLFFLTPKALKFHNLHPDPSICTVDVFELVGKNVKPGKPIRMGRLSFSKLPFLNGLIRRVANYVKTLHPDYLLV